MARTRIARPAGTTRDRQSTRRPDVPWPRASAGPGAIPPRGVPPEIGLHQAVQVALQHTLGIADLEPGAVVLDLGVRLQHVGADLAAPLRLDVITPELLHVLQVLLPGQRQQLA